MIVNYGKSYDRNLRSQLRQASSMKPRSQFYSAGYCHYNRKLHIPFVNYDCKTFIAQATGLSTSTLRSGSQCLKVCLGRGSNWGSFGFCLLSQTSPAEPQAPNISLRWKQLVCYQKQYSNKTKSHITTKCFRPLFQFNQL